MKHTDLINKLGRANVMAALNVGPAAVSIALKRSDKLPASWYLALSCLAKDAGISCPITLFAMKGMDELTIVQGQVSHAVDAA